MELFTRAQVAEFSGPEKVYLIIHGKVYDVSDYRFVHPGKEAVMMKFAGKDATQAFEALYHSSRARNRLNDLLVGEIVQ